MSIPIDRLYHYIDSVANKVYGDVVISHFWPHGSKNINDLVYVRNKSWYNTSTQPWIMCHDQEPLDSEHFTNYYSQLSGNYMELTKKYQCWHTWDLKFPNIFDQSILIHSEQRSKEVDIYASHQFIPVYYWSHAIIARDWFRFAQYVNQKKQVQKTFLIYNRAWAGTREYRIKFADFLVASGLVSHCKTTFNCVDPETNIDYHQYCFRNDQWKTNLDLSAWFTPNPYPATSSADFVLEDYEQTHIEVVLETQFDDSRIQLTEKILRPIACGQPFILASTLGCLDYLRKYGFKTFDSVWDESYDQIADPYQRLESITDVMKQISTWDPETKNNKLSQAQEIADYNKQHFFSKEFFDQVCNELTDNLRQALNQVVETNTCSRWLQLRKKLCQHQELKNIMIGRSRHLDSKQKIYCATTDVVKVLTAARKYMRS